MASLLAPRLLAPSPILSLAEHVAEGGGRGLELARRSERTALIETVADAGLRGRGGAGFPTAAKWKTVLDHRSDIVATTVVVNAAEGEPGSFKDRHLLRMRPHLVLEGAIIAALAVDAREIIVALKASFTEEIQQVRDAVESLGEAGWTDGLEVRVFEGPGAYLFGEETGLLEAISGREPFPRIAPPFRHGAVEVGPEALESHSAANVQLATPAEETVAPPTLVNNVETLANVPGIVAEGPGWFRSLGTDRSPGSIVCTVSGDTTRAGVGEFPMGTTLEQVIDDLGAGLEPGRRVTAVLSGVANPMLPSSDIDTPLTYEAMRAAGSGLGAAGFIVFDDARDPVAIAEGVARFLAIESCGQCVPCKRDGLELAERLGRIRASQEPTDDAAQLDVLVERVVDEARCNLAYQQQAVIGSLLRHFPDAFDVDDMGDGGVEPILIAPIIDIVDGRASLDERQADKQPDWSHVEPWSGKWPAQHEDARGRSDE